MLMRLIVFLFLLAFVADAEIVDSTAHGFTIRDTVIIGKPPLDVYHHIVKDVGKWWNSAHTWSGKASNLSIEDRAQGCFCEKLADGGSVRHMEVVFAAPGSTLRMIGGLGPLQSMAVTGSMTWSLSKSGNGTRLEVTYTVGGYLRGGLGNLAPIVDRVVFEQMTRLKNFIEKGKPD
jgi:hypothetical protein